MKGALIVDDEEDICELLADELKKMDFETDFALTGEKALELIREKEYAVTIVDLKLVTSVTGIDVMREIRRKWPRTKVVAMTGYVDVGLRQETEKLGVSDFLLKPDDLRAEVFSSRIRRLL